MTPSPMRVCVIDDEMRLRELLVREIAAMGFTAMGFRSAEEAWPPLERGEFDALLVDLNLPGISGMELFQRVHAARPETAVVILTGFGSLDTAVQALRWGATDYLTKPCSLDQIETVLLRIDRSRREAHLAKKGEAVSGHREEREAAASSPAAPRRLEDIEREQILAAMQEHGGHKPRVAEALGISLRTLYNKLNAYRAQGRIK